jgi:hypothetical protein
VLIRRVEKQPTNLACGESLSIAGSAFVIAILFLTRSRLRINGIGQDGCRGNVDARAAILRPFRRDTSTRALKRAALLLVFDAN